MRERYDIFQPLGSGAYATVYKALHTTEKKWYAMKIFHKNAFIVGQEVARRLKEIEVLQRLHHKYVVEFKEAIEGNDSISMLTCYLSSQIRTIIIDL